MSQSSRKEQKGDDDLNVPHKTKKQIDDEVAYLLDAHDTYMSSDWEHRAEKAEIFKNIIMKASSEAINILVKSRDKSGDHYILEFVWQEEREQIGDALIQKADPNIIKTAMRLKDYHGRLLLSDAFESGSIALRQLIKIIDVQEIKQVLKDLWVLNGVIKNSPEKLLFEILQKADKNDIAKTVSSTYGFFSYSNQTPFHTAAKNLSEDAFIKLIGIIGTEAINRAMTYQDDHKETPLHVTARNQTTPAFLELISKSDSKALSKAIVMKNKFGMTGLYVAMFKQSPICIATLIEKVTQQALNQACFEVDKKGQSILLVAVASPDVTQMLLNKIDDKALAFMLNQPPTVIPAIAKYLLREPAWAVEPLVSRLFKIGGQELALAFYKACQKQNDIQPKVMDYARPYLEKIVDSNVLNVGIGKMLGLKYQKYHAAEGEVLQRAIKTLMNVTSLAKVSKDDCFVAAEIFHAQHLKDHESIHKLKELEYLYQGAIMLNTDSQSLDNMDTRSDDIFLLNSTCMSINETKGVPKADAIDEDQYKRAIEALKKLEYWSVPSLGEAKEGKEIDVQASSGTTTSVMKELSIEAHVTKKTDESKSIPVASSSSPAATVAISHFSVESAAENWDKLSSFMRRVNNVSGSMSKSLYKDINKNDRDMLNDAYKKLNDKDTSDYDKKDIIKGAIAVIDSCRGLSPADKNEFCNILDGMRSSLDRENTFRR